MSSPADPADPLTSPLLAVRVEAVRELGLRGGAEVLDRLLTLALEDLSSGVRLAAASAAADVLARCRLGPGREDLPEQGRRAVLQRLRGIDPGRNTGLFQVLACLGLPEVLVPIAKGVRDPRVDVRTGAIVGLSRLCSSGGANGDAHVERALGDLLAETRLRPDVSLELARLARRAGFVRLRPAVARLAARTGERWRAPVEQVLADFPVGLTAETVYGCWTSQGLDCGELRARADPVRWLVLLPGTLAALGTEGGDVRPWSFEPGGEPDGEPGGVSCILPFAGLVPGCATPVRRLQAWMGGRDGIEVLQIGEGSWAAAPEKDLPELCDLLVVVADGAHRARLAAALLDHLGPGLSDRAPAAYVRAVLPGVAGRPAEAAERLAELCAAPRVRAEAWWHLSMARGALGETVGARAALESYLAQASRKSRFWEAAQAQVAGREG